MDAFSPEKCLEIRKIIGQWKDQRQVNGFIEPCETDRHIYIHYLVAGKFYYWECSRMDFKVPLSANIKNDILKFLENPSIYPFLKV